MEETQIFPDRTQAPHAQEIGHMALIEPAFKQLDNGVPLWLVDAGEQDLVRVECVFQHVNWDSSRPLQATAVLAQLNEGTKTHTAEQIAEHLDYYGAFLQTDFTFDQSVIALYTLNKHLARVLPVFMDLLQSPVFPDRELETYRRNQKQKLRVSQEKNEFLARKKFNKILFGENLYGHETAPEDFDTLDRAQLLAYHAASFQPRNVQVIIAGKITPEVNELISQAFSAWQNSEAPAQKNHFHFDALHGAFEQTGKKDALQSAIRMGKRMVNRVHADFAGLQVLNTILGGYFGSRLMANIREEKGYTYGIGSGLVSLQQAGYFFIASEVGADVCADAISEIRKEINTLREHLVPDDELHRVRNYMLGSFLGSLENAFSHADKFKNIHFSGLDYSYYTRYIETVRHITPKELLHLAQRYLDPEEMVTVVAGKY